MSFLPGLLVGVDRNKNTNDKTISNRFTTGIIKGGPNLWAIRGGNAASGGLTTFYSGVRPNADGYNPMKKEGAIILGIGGDNSDSGAGTFYEGVMTSGYPSDATENSVQADIVNAKYAVTSLVSGPVFAVGSSISLRVTTPGYNTRYLAHTGGDVNTQVVTSSNSTAVKQQASWTVRAGLAYSECVSFESKDTPGSFIRQASFVLHVNANDNSKAFKEDATFCPQTPLNGQGTSLRSFKFPTRYIRHFLAVGYIASNGGVDGFDYTGSYNDDVSWAIEGSFA